MYLLLLHLNAVTLAVKKNKLLLLSLEQYSSSRQNCRIESERDQNANRYYYSVLIYTGLVECSSSYSNWMTTSKIVEAMMEWMRQGGSKK